MKYTFKQFQAEYPDDAACLDRIMQEQYGGTEIACPSCGVVTKFHAMSGRRAFACQDCGHHIYPCAGTIFHKSSTKLTNWFFRHVPDDQHAPRRCGEGIGAANRLHLQNGVAHGARASQADGFG